MYLCELTGARVIVNLCCYGEIAIHFGAFAVDDYHSQTCPLGLVLCECCICVIGLEVLNLLEVRFLLNGAHFAEQIWGLKQDRVTFQKVRW